MFHFLLLTAAVLATTHAATHSARGHAAARSSDVATLKEIYKGSNLINIPEPGSGQTPLMAAILSGQTKAVKVLLLELNADPTIPEKDGYTPPHGAGFQVCSTSNVERIIFTLSNGSFNKARQQKTTSQHGLTN